MLQLYDLKYSLYKSLHLCNYYINDGLIFKENLSISDPGSVKLNSLRFPKEMRTPYFIHNLYKEYQVIDHTSYDNILKKYDLQKCINKYTVSISDAQSAFKVINRIHEYVYSEICKYFGISASALNDYIGIKNVGFSNVGLNYQYGVSNKRGIGDDNIVLQVENVVENFVSTVIAKLFHQYFINQGFNYHQRTKLIQFFTQELLINLNIKTSCLHFDETIKLYGIVLKNEANVLLKNLFVKYPLHICNEQIYYKNENLHNNFSTTQNLILIGLLKTFPDVALYENVYKQIMNNPFYDKDVDNYSLYSIAKHISRLRKRLNKLEIDDVKIITVSKKGFRLEMNSLNDDIDN